MMFKILVVEDYKSQSRLMKAVLNHAGYEIYLAHNGAIALDVLDQVHIDLIVLDIMMPEMNGYEFAETIRKSGNMIPILMLTAKQLTFDKVKGFQCGTDDYMTKPANEEELLWRIKALLRRSKEASEHKLQIGQVVLDSDGFTVTRGDDKQTLPKKEFQLSTNPVRLFIKLALISILLGTLLSVIFCRIPIKIIRKIMVAIDALAAGDFSTRINLKGTPELQQLSTSFNHMAEELNSIEILRSDFVNNFSHEFKSPIVSMRGFAKMLKYNNLTQEERDEYLDIIISESDRLVELSTNVLNLSKIETQSIVSNSKEYNLTEQIRRCIAIVAQKWHIKDPSFDFDSEEMKFIGDEDLISQVWINLIDNAIKFSTSHIIIHMSLHRGKGFIRFTISDNGPGMDEETQKHIFDKFYQGDTSHAAHGNGLGLAITKKIIELHGGRIYVQCEGSNGTTFTVELPIQR